MSCFFIIGKIDNLLLKRYIRKKFRNKMRFYRHKMLKKHKYRYKKNNCYLCNKNIIIFVIRKH